MIKNFSADYIFTLSGEPLKNGVVAVDENGEIINIFEADDFDSESVERFSGIIVPGFVNSHCHLELSHLEGKLKKGLKLVEFLKSVIKNRSAEEKVIVEGMEKADRLMFKNCI